MHRALVFNESHHVHLQSYQRWHAVSLTCLYVRLLLVVAYLLKHHSIFSCHVLEYISTVYKGGKLQSVQSVIV